MVSFRLPLHSTLKLLSFNAAFNVVLKANRREGKDDKEVGDAVKPALELL